MSERTITLRTGTQDEREFACVLAGNEYRLPARLPEDAQIIDVGAQIGCFAVACLERGAGHVYCVEPEPSNLKLLETNLAQYAGRFTIIPGAVWHDGAGDKVFLRVRQGGNTAMHALAEEGLPVDRVSLDALIRSALGLIHTLKLDCEGAEYPALYHCRELAKVERVIGESHRLPGAERVKGAVDGEQYELDHAGLISFLQHQGFRCRVQPNSPDMPHQNKLFWAERQ